MINNTRGKTNLSFCSLHKNVKLLLYEQVSDHRLRAKNVSKKIEIKLSFFFFSRFGEFAGVYYVSTNLLCLFYHHSK